MRNTACLPQSCLLSSFIIIALLTGLTALYVGAEFAVVKSRRTRISQLAASGNRFARQLLPILEDSRKLDQFVAACQVGISLTGLLLGAYGEAVLAPRLAPLLGGTQSHSLAATIVLLLLTILLVLLGELIPKSLALQYPHRTALASMLPMRASQIIFAPLIWLLNGSALVLLRLLGRSAAPVRGSLHSAEEIEQLVEDSHAGGVLDADERQMLRNTLRLRDRVARQVMTPRTRLYAAPADSSVHALLQGACEAGHSRIPLYRNTIDQIIGFVHIKDVLRLQVQGRENLAEILREAVFVPETLPLAAVWAALETKHQYMATVFDEYGGTAGIITMEDLLEEIFGELQDEFDTKENALVSADKTGRLFLRGELLVEDVNEYLALSLPEQEMDTLGGLVFEALGRRPSVGDEVTLGVPGISVRVESIDELAVLEVSLLLGPKVQTQVGEWAVAARE
ncbi:UPF0053 protein YhdP [Anaerolineaceae bacterium]|nr:UPF0053 protein YhdP [Anaerolineaceae bacterium]